MKMYNLPFEQTGMFSQLFCDYVAEREAVSHFYKYPLSYDIVPRIIEEKRMQELDRELLVKVINRQYQHIAAPDIVVNNIDYLRQENTFTITTAHQPNLFTGPLYFIIKIQSAINMANELSKRYPDHHFVPMYWMGAEDHDFEEINHIWLFGEKIEWLQPSGGPVGSLNTKAIRKPIDEIRKIAGNLPFAGEWLQLLEEAYLNHDCLADATRFLVNKLFGKQGLVVLDGNDKDLKATFKAAMREELLYQKSSSLIKDKISALKKKYKIQAMGRPINLFYLGKHSRERIEYDKSTSTFKVLNTDILFTKEEILQELDTHPDRFSPNVILRPLYQETVLPNLAFVGGSGELAYWLELEALFEHHHINFPMLVPRNSVMIIGKTAVKKMESLALEINDLFKDTDDLIRAYVEQHTEEELNLEKESEKIHKAFERILEKALEIDITLERPVKSELQKTMNSLNTLEAKMLKAEKRKFETAINQVRYLKNNLFPGNGLQERHENLSAFYLREGSGFIDRLAKAIKPIERQFVIMLDA